MENGLLSDLDKGVAAAFFFKIKGDFCIKYTLIKRNQPVHVRCYKSNVMDTVYQFHYRLLLSK
jgi:hypothetical protein